MKTAIFVGQMLIKCQLPMKLKNMFHKKISYRIGREVSKVLNMQNNKMTCLYILYEVIT